MDSWFDDIIKKDKARMGFGNQNSTESIAFSKNKIVSRGTAPKLHLPTRTVALKGAISGSVRQGISGSQRIVSMPAQAAAAIARRSKIKVVTANQYKKAHNIAVYK
jgi:hypothetical protein